MAGGHAGRDSALPTQLDGVQLSPKMRTERHKRLGLYAHGILGRTG